jgi:hemerythrin-like metal-binding protein
MPFLNWEDRFELGVKKMDNEHKGLIDTMNALFEQNERNESRARLRSTLLELERRTVEHFKHEEEYQQSINFPGFAVHKRVHQNLLERLEGYKKAFLAGEDLSPDFFTFLKLWLSGHIVGVDPKYARHAHQAA